MTRPAEDLTGQSLDGGWLVEQLIVPGPNATGGHFSVGYLTSNIKTGQKGYLKALDFSSAMQSPDPARVLQSMTTAYNFERDLLSKCKDRNMTRVVTPLADGSVNLSAHGPLGNVCYIIFECADGDIRSQISQTSYLDLAWVLRSLHHTAVGLQQLHFSHIVHQDLKPSNVLVFKDNGSKIADLGRASDLAIQSDVDSCPMPGDRTYAPIEQLYRQVPAQNFEERRAADMYLFGNMFFFYFSNCSTTQAIITKLNQTPNLNLSSDLMTAMPYLRNAFYEVLSDLRQDTLPVAKGLTDAIVNMAKELCEPDPLERGDRKNIPRLSSQYSLERYISVLNVLARRVEMGRK